jgi:hypothetical protein
MIRDILGTQNVNVSFSGGGPVLFACALAAIVAGLSAWQARSDVQAIRLEMANELRDMRSETDADLREMREKLDVMQAHLSAIYMQAPHLKPETDK